MTFQELLASDSPDIWEAVADEEMIKLASPFFNVTRPDLAAKGGGDMGDLKPKANSSGKRSGGGGGNMSFESLKKDLLRQATLAGIQINLPLPKI